MWDVETELTAVTPVTTIKDVLWGKPPGPRKG